MNAVRTAITQQSRAKNRRPALAATFAAFVVGALMLLGLESPSLYPGLVGGALIVLVLVVRPWLRSSGITALRRGIDWQDMIVILALYAVAVSLFKLAFGVFGVERIPGMFLSYGAGLVLGVAVPVIYTVLVRHRSFSDLGVGLRNWKPTFGFAIVFAGTQFALTLWGYDLPKPVDWVPLLVMSLTVGLFESIFFRGFVIGALERSVGALPAVLGAAALYGFYHVGYGMTLKECLFLTGLGITYGVAYRITQNVLVLWPLFTPLGGFFNMLENGDITMPWLAILGFIDVTALMVTAFTITRRIDRKRRTQTSAAGVGDASQAAA